MADRGRATLSDIFAVFRCPHLTEHEKVLWGLYRSYDRGDGAWPGDETLQTHMSTPEKRPGDPPRPKSLRAIRGYRSSLIEKGYLVQRLNGPHPAGYSAIVPQETPAESCPPRAAGSFPSRMEDRQDPASLDRQGSAAVAPDRQDAAPVDRQDVAALEEDRQEERQEGRQDPAAPPAPPLVVEYGKYGKETADVADTEQSDSPQDQSIDSDVDGVTRFRERWPDAAEALGRLGHTGGWHATATALRMRFLYVDESTAMPEPSVKGLDLERRVEMVGAAIIEGMVQGWDRFSVPALAGFIRRLRTRPDPEGDHPGMSASEEEEREVERREAARARQRSGDAISRAHSDAEAEAADAERRRLIQEAYAWLARLGPEDRARADLKIKTRLLTQFGEGNHSRMLVEAKTLEVVHELRREAEAA